MNNTSIIGAGAWGTTLSLLLSEKEYNVKLWVFEKEVLNDFLEFRENKRYLPGFQIPEKIEITGELNQAISSADIIIFAIPAQHLAGTLKKIKAIPNNALLISAIKGIEIPSLKRPSQILEEFFKNNIAVLSGPNLAKEIAKGLPSATVAAAKEIHLAQKIQKVLMSERFRVYAHDDIAGVELGGALKNIIAIASGIADGLNLGENARAALIVRGITEISRLGCAMGGLEKTFYGLSGIGDLIVTCSSAQSRNHTVGVKLSQGKKLEEITSSMPQIAEGIPTCRAAKNLAQKLNIETPIINQTYAVLFEGKDPYEALSHLLKRSARDELTQPGDFFF